MHVTRQAQVGWLLSVKQHVTEINRYCIVLYHNTLFAITKCNNMAVIHRVLYAEQMRALQRERNFRPRCMPLDLGDQEFIFRYRVSKDIATTLIDLLGHTELATKMARSHAITDDIKVIIKLKVTLSFVLC